MKPKFILPILLAFSIIGCTSNVKPVDPVNPDNPNPPVEPDIPEIPDTPTPKEASWSFMSLPMTGNLYNGTTADDLVKYMNNQCSEDLVTSITSNNAQINTYVANGTNINRLWIGSGSKEGNVKFIFNVNITSVTIEACAYHKFNTYGNAWSCDENAAMYVNSDDNSLGIVVEDSQKEQNSVKKTFTFDTSVNNIDLYNKNAKERSFLYTLKITY